MCKLHVHRFSTWPEGSTLGVCLTPHSVWVPLLCWKERDYSVCRHGKRAHALAARVSAVLRHARALVVKNHVYIITIFVVYANRCSKRGFSTLLPLPFMAGGLGLASEHTMNGATWVSNQRENRR